MPSSKRTYGKNSITHLSSNLSKGERESFVPLEDFDYGFDKDKAHQQSRAIWSANPPSTYSHIPKAFGDRTPSGTPFETHYTEDGTYRQYAGPRQTDRQGARSPNKIYSTTTVSTSIGNRPRDDFF